MKKTLIQCVLAILVIVIGVIIVVKFIRLCQHLFPDTPQNPDPTNVVKSASFIVGARPPGFATRGDPQGFVPVEDVCDFSFSYLLTAQGLCLTNCTLPRMVTMDVLATELAAVGLAIDATRTSYGAGTVQSDISFAGGTITVGQGVTAVVERSPDLEAWEPVMTNSFAAGQVLSVTVPVPCGSNSFFRAVLR